MNHVSATLLAGLIAISGLSCTPIEPNQPAGNIPQPNRRSDSPEVSAPNLVGIFIVRKDNLRNRFSAELFPIALYINEQYVDASEDVTPFVRINFDPEQLVQLYDRKSLLSAIREFTVVSTDQSLGQFTVEALQPSQFSCSTLLTGTGQLEGTDALPDLYAALPEDLSGATSGLINGQTVDETWRGMIALSRYHALSATQNLEEPSDADLMPDLLAAAQPLLSEANAPSDQAAVVEQITRFDLNRDGYPEVFSTVRQGLAPESIPPDQVGQPGNLTVYVNLWLSYTDGVPTVIAREVIPYEFPVSRSPYEVVGALDITGDGIAEVVVQNNGYESTSFSIYEWQDTELQEVFSGASYGC